MPATRVLAAAVIALALLLPQSAVAQPDVAVAGDLHPPGGAPVRAPADVAAYLDEAAARMGGTAVTVEPASADGVEERTVVAGDLTGNGHPDLLTVRHERLPDGSLDWVLGGYADFRMTVRARSGLDGTELWSFTDEANLLAAVPTDGPGGAGVLIVAYDAGRVGDVAAWAYPLTLRLEALDATGTSLWETSFDGAHTAVNFVGQAGTQVPYYVGVLDAVAGSGDDVLVETVDWVINGRTDTFVIQVTALVVDGADGEVASETSHLMQTDWGAGPVTVPVGDLDGDGADDYLYLVGAVGAEPPAVIARRGFDGALLWETDAVAVSGFSPVVWLGDVTGDGAGDVAIVAAATVHLVQGGDGAVAWNRPGTGAYRLGDVTGDGIAEVATVSLDYDGTVLAWRLAAVDAAGEALYEVVHGLEDVSDATSLQAGGWLAGDVNDDGAEDAALLLRAVFGDGADELALHRLVSGATGLPLRVLIDEQPLGGTVTGAGDDFVRFGDGPGVPLTTLNGRTGKPVWSATALPDVDVATFTYQALDLTGDGLADILIDAATAAGRQVTVLHGEDGQVLWSD